MRTAIFLTMVLGLAGCMRVSDMAESARDHLGDAGLLDHAETHRYSHWRLQPDSLIYIAQGHFVPPGDAWPRPNVVAEEAFKGFVEYFPSVRRAPAPVGLDEAWNQAAAEGAHYVLYTRFAVADDRTGTREEWNARPEIERLGVDSGVVQMMLYETGTHYLVDTARIRGRGGVLTLRNHRPEDLLGPPLREYARQLLGLQD